MAHSLAVPKRQEYFDRVIDKAGWLANLVPSMVVVVVD